MGRRRDISRLRAAWLTLLHGQQLPDIRVRYTREPIGDDLVLVTFSFDYPGDVHARVDGQDVWTRNGTFTIEQNLNYRFLLRSHDVTSEEFGTAVDFIRQLRQGMVDKLTESMNP